MKVETLAEPAGTAIPTPGEPLLVGRPEGMTMETHIKDGRYQMIV